MNRFAFVVHPLDAGDVAKKYTFARYLPDIVVENALRLMPPMKVSNITGVCSKFGQAEGWFVVCPLTARQIIKLSPTYVLRRVIQAGRVAEKLGAKILGLGAFTKIVGDAGITVAKNLSIPVTTGNSYTVATAIEGAKEAACLMGHDLKKARVVIVGATGSIGRVCALILAREIHNLTLVARHEETLEELAQEILSETGLVAQVSSDTKKALKSAEVVITVTSALDTIIGPKDLKPGAVVCDVARPRNVAQQVAEVRDDVLVIEGGVVEVPGDVNFNFNFGFPQKTAYACMAETMILAMENRYESYTLGRELTVEQVENISALAKKHGFKLAGFRSFERSLTLEEIEKIKERAGFKV